MKTLLQNNSGATSIEYAVITFLVAIILVTVINVTGVYGTAAQITAAFAPVVHAVDDKSSH